MFNLLPETEKKNILKEYSLRRDIVLCMFVFAAGIIASIALFPSYILSSAKIQEVQDQIQSISNSSAFLEAGSLSSALATTTMKIQALKPGPTDVYLEDLLTKIFDKRTVNIRISEVTYQKTTSDQPGTITVSGIAHDRESLSSFVDSLKLEPLFTTVDLPISNFAEDRNAAFSIQIQGTF